MTEHWRRRQAGWIGAVTAGALALACVQSGQAQKMHSNPFESANQLSWIKGSADAPYSVLQHIRSDKAANDGQRSEMIQIDAKPGNYILYQYPLGKAPITEELSVGVWVKANRPGAKLMARVVLPHERDPKHLNDVVTAILHGDGYRLTNRWQKLELNQPVVLKNRLQQMMQSKDHLNRPVNFKDAYIDMLYLNIYGGPGDNTVWIDDLEAGPVFEAVAAPQPKEPGTDKLVSQTKPERPLAVVEFSGAQLLVGGKRFFMRGIRYSDTPLKVLRNAGFNTLWVPHSASPALLRQATDMGFWLVPSLPIVDGNKQLIPQNVLGQEVTRFAEPDSVLWWDLGASLASEQANVLAKSVQIVRAADPDRPVGGDVWDGFLPYSRNLNLMGIHRWPLMTGLELSSYGRWLEQRRLLAAPGSYLWSWVQTHTPEFFSQLLYNQTAAKPFDMPVGPLPAQIQLLAYTAVGAGCRGLGFWSDRFLADSHQGRDRLLSVAVLNKELEMLEPLLVTIDGPPAWIKTSEKDVQAAVFRTAKGVLVLPMWLGKGAQFVPGQSAANKLDIVVPQVSQGTQAWEVTPGEVRSLKATRDYGGTKVVVPDFDLTTAIVFTSDTKLIVRFQEHCRAIRQFAAEWTYAQAVEEKRKVEIIQQQLAQLGQAIPQTESLLTQARKRLESAKQHWDTHHYSESYREAQRALRPLRILMRAQWENAVKGLDSPVAVPHAVSYYTLPTFWQMAQELRQASPGANVLPGGDFEDAPGQTQTSWFPVEVPSLDEVTQKAQRVGSAAGASVTPKKGKLCGALMVAPKTPNARIGALERTYVAVNSPQVKLAPGTLVKISAWIHIPQPILASVDGVLFFDSTAGEPLAIRLTDATAWKQFSIYRRVPPSGTLNVTLALSGIGTAYFDDVRIEPMLAEANGAQ